MIRAKYDSERLQAAAEKAVKDKKEKDHPGSSGAGSSQYCKSICIESLKYSLVCYKDRLMYDESVKLRKYTQAAFGWGIK